MSEQLRNFQIQVQKFNDGPHAQLVRQHTEGTGDTGYDLFVQEDITLHPKVATLVPNGVAVALPPGWACEIRPRSSNLKRKTIYHPYAAQGSGSEAEAPAPVHVQYGTIDNPFRGQLQTMAMNMGDYPITLKAGDRISQLVVVKVHTPEIVYVDRLDETQRGDAGWGSTGTHEAAKA